MLFKSLIKISHPDRAEGDWNDRAWKTIVFQHTKPEDHYFHRHPSEFMLASNVEPMKAVTLDKEFMETRWEPCCGKKLARLAHFKFGQRIKIAVSLCAVCLSVLVVLFSLSIVLLLRIRYTSKGDLMGACECAVLSTRAALAVTTLTLPRPLCSDMTALVNGCLIQIFSVLYSWVALKLTNWEVRPVTPIDPGILQLTRSLCCPEPPHGIQARERICVEELHA